jgi:hypothetical protein
MVSKPPLSLVIFAYFLYFLSFSEAQTNVTTTTTIQTTSTPVNCDTENQFKCKEENTCIPVEWVCDYVNDCKNGEVGKLNSFFIVPGAECYQAQGGGGRRESPKRILLPSSSCIKMLQF